MRQIRIEDNKKTGAKAVRQAGKSRIGVCSSICLNVCMFVNEHLPLYVQLCACQGTFVRSALTSEAEIASGKLLSTEELFKRDRTQTSEILRSLPGMGFSSPPTCRWKSGSEMIRFGRHITLNPHSRNR